MVWETPPHIGVSSAVCGSSERTVVYVNYTMVKRGFAGVIKLRVVR